MQKERERERGLLQPSIIKGEPQPHIVNTSLKPEEKVRDNLFYVYKLHLLHIIQRIYTECIPSDNTHRFVLLYTRCIYTHCTPYVCLMNRNSFLSLSLSLSLSLFLFLLQVQKGKKEKRKSKQDVGCARCTHINIHCKVCARRALHRYGSSDPVSCPLLSYQGVLFIFFVNLFCVFFLTKKRG